jgi:hypothetical protein
MSFAFSCSILELRNTSRNVLRIEVPFVAFGAHGPRSRSFVFDTGCQITCVSEDVAAKLGLPTG